MKFEVIQAGDLGSDLIRQWSSIQESDPALASPYFRPEFTQAVAEVRNDVFVCLLRDGNRIAGFFPFHRSRGKVGRPIGLALSDYHGVIVERAAEWTAEDLMRGCALVRWEFDHLLESQTQFRRFHAEVSDSPIIEVSGGFEAFKASRDKAGRKQLKEIERKREKMAADVGPIRFAEHTGEAAILQQVFQWKSLQCRETGTVDYFALDWCTRLIERIHASRSAEFGGILSSLHAGDQLAAAHFAMYSRGVWHSWFPTYNDGLQDYSPGFMLLVDMIKAAADANVSHIDLGKGLSLYKKRVATGGIPVASGRAEVPSLRNRVRHLLEDLEHWGRGSRFKPVLSIPGRIIRRIERRERYR